MNKRVKDGDFFFSLFLQIKVDVVVYLRNLIYQENSSQEESNQMSCFILS